MAGSRNVRWRCGVTLVVIAACFVSPGRIAPAQGQPAARTPLTDFASMLDTEGPPSAMSGLPNGTQPDYGTGPYEGRYGPRVEMGLFDTITESLFGDVYAEG